MWIVVDDGEVFEGDELHWADCFFSNVSEDLVRQFCKEQGWKCVILPDTREDRDPVFRERLAALATRLHSDFVLAEFMPTTEKVVLVSQTIRAAAFNSQKRNSAFSFVGKSAKGFSGGGLMNNIAALHGLLHNGYFRAAVISFDDALKVPPQDNPDDYAKTPYGYEVLYPTAKLLAAVEGFLGKDEAVANV